VFQTPAPLIELDPVEVDQRFGRRGFSVRHHLRDHPLTQLEALATLADSLPRERVEHNLGSVGELMPGGEVPRTDLTPGDIVRTIETNGCWIALPINGVPAYRELFESLLETVTSRLPAGERAMRRHQAVFFLSAPDSTTPTHVDLEQGYLLQLVGTKQVSVGEFADQAVALREVERFCAGGHRNLDDLPHDADTFELSPGEGAHIPALVPHLVKTATEVSISLSVGFETEAVIRRARVHQANAYLRRLGLSPARPGEHPGRDRAKERLVETASRAVRVVRRSK
jgi:hypothetical protein